MIRREIPSNKFWKFVNYFERREKTQKLHATYPGLGFYEEIFYSEGMAIELFKGGSEPFGHLEIHSENDKKAKGLLKELNEKF